MRKLLSSLVAFAKWYWRRVKEIPLVVGSFTLGGLYVAVLISVPRLAYAAARLM